VYFPHRTFVSDVSEIPISFPFPELPFSILFPIKNMKTVMVLVFTDRFRPFLSLVGWVYLDHGTPAAGRNRVESERARGAVSTVVLEGAWAHGTAARGIRLQLQGEEVQRSGAGQHKQNNRIPRQLRRRRQCPLRRTPGTLLLSRALSLRFCAHFTLHAEVASPAGQVFSFFFSVVQRFTHARGMFRHENLCFSGCYR
jgi:hypothetical protein